MCSSHRVHSRSTLQKGFGESFFSSCFLREKFVSATLSEISVWEIVILVDFALCKGTDTQHLFVETNPYTGGIIISRLESILHGIGRFCDGSTCELTHDFRRNPIFTLYQRIKASFFCFVEKTTSHRNKLFGSNYARK